MLRVLYDGWPLIYEPLSPAALHLLALLENLPGDVQPIVALPGSPPPWFEKNIDTHTQAMEQGMTRRLRWEQHILPRIVKSSTARLLHLTTSNPALFTTAPTMVSPAGYTNRNPQKGFITRAREALSLGGMTRVRGVFWPADLPQPKLTVPVFKLPPIVPSYLLKNSPPSQTHTTALDLPETFILYHGSYRELDLQHLVAAWSWAAELLEDYYPIYLLGIDEAAREHISRLTDQSAVNGNFIPVTSASPLQLAQFYRGCSLLFHPTEVYPWGGAVRYALACGKPVIALETPLTDAMVGNAAYLLKKGDTRAQGAALIAVTGEQELADQLSNAAKERSASWNASDFGNQLLEAYKVALE